MSPLIRNIKASIIMKQLFLISFILIFFNVNYAQYQVNWHNLVNFSLDPVTNILSKTSSNGMNSTAISTNKLNANTDGIVTIEINSTGVSRRMIGLAEYNTSITSFDMDYVVDIITNNTVYIREFGVSKISFSSLQIGDKVSIERNGNQIIYRKEDVNGNQSILRSVTTDPAKELYVDALGEKGIISGVTCSFQEGFTLEQKTLHHHNTTTNTLGSIDVNVTGTAPFSYNWTNVSNTSIASSQDISGLSAGTYNLSVSDANGNTLTQSFTIKTIQNHNITWHNLVNFSLAPVTNILSKTSSNGMNSTAISTNKLNANTDGIVTIEINSTGVSRRMIGLAEYNTSITSFDMDYVVDIITNNTVYIREFGVSKVSFSSLQIGDKVSIERNGNQIIYRKEDVNGNQSILRSVTTDPAKELYVDALGEKGIISGVTCSFQEGFTLEQKTLHHHNTTTNTLGSIDVNVTGTAPFSYNWTNVSNTSIASSQDISGLSAGTYNLSVSDANGNTLTQSFTIKTIQNHNITWHNLVNFSLDPVTNILSKTSSNGMNSTAISTNKLNANTDGIVTIEINSTGVSRRMIGLAEYNTSITSFDMDYVVDIITNNTVYIREFGVSKISFSSLQIGDKVSIERNGNQIIYRKEDVNGNQSILRSVTTDPAKELYVDALGEKGIISGVTCSFQEGFTLEQKTLHHHNTTTNTLGFIDVNVTGTAPFSYNWTNVSNTSIASSQDISGLSAGTYNLSVSDANGNTLTQSFTIKTIQNHNITWHNLVNFSLAPVTNILSKTSSNGMNSTAISTNKLNANTDGIVTIEINSTGVSRRMIGLAEYNTSTTYFDMDYVVDIITNNTVYIRESGVSKISFPSLQIGDKVSIERNGNQIIYRKEDVNGNQSILRSVTTDPAKELYVDALGERGIINGITCSFYTPLNIPYHPLINHLSGGYYNLSGSELHFSYYQRYTPSSSDLNYEIIDKTNTSVSVTLPVIPVLQGENHLTIDFSTLGLASGYYTLKVTNEKNEIKQLRFKI